MFLMLICFGFRRCNAGHAGVVATKSFANGKLPSANGAIIRGGAAGQGASIPIPLVAPSSLRPTGVLAHERPR
jgi:hypothetical protein